MEYRPYDSVMLFMGVLSTKGFPQSLQDRLQEKFGPIRSVSTPFPFSFTDYYVPEMGEGIERFFVSFSRLVSPASLTEAKRITNEIEKEWEEDGKRKINLDPGTLSEANIILATTKNRAHRIAIGENMYAEVTLIYQNHGYQSFPWTYSDYKSSLVQDILLDLRKDYLRMRKETKECPVSAKDSNNM